MENKKKKIIFYLILLSTLYFLFSASSVFAASLYFSPSSGSYTVGSTFPVAVKVNTGGEAINAADGILIFNPAELQVISLLKSSSIFSLWTTEPTFSNSAGNIIFGGGTPTAFTGTTGTIITITFKAKASASAEVSFSSGSVLAADGKGTNILTSLGNAQFSLGGTALTIPKSTTPSVVSSTPSAPAISSPTHPDPNKWYSKKDAEFIWTAPSNATAVRMMYDKYPNTTPKVIYSPAISEKQLENIKDGIYYFHVQLKNAKGWGEVSHFRFQIDTQPPNPFMIKFIDGNETENPRPTVVFDATDSLSGIGYYKVKIGEGDFFSVAPETVKTNPYTLPFQNPGKRNILVQAFDNAENYSVATEEFTIKPLQAPILQIGSWAFSFLSVLIFLILFIIILIFILWCGWHKFFTFRRKLKNEIRGAESAIHKAFDFLKEDIREQIKMLEKTRNKRQLTEEEDKILKQLMKDLDDTERFVRKEIEDINQKKGK